MANIIDTSTVDPDALNLKLMLDGVLAKVVSVFQSYNVPLPTRQFWTLGQPAIDCEQLVVSFIQMYLGPPGDQASEPKRCNSPRSAVLNIMLCRPVPVVGQNGRAPSADKIEEGGVISAIDAWVLMEAMQLFDQWDDYGLGLGVIATVDAPVQQGGFQAINMQITMAVP
jgi:hypothetical protein